jgi:hypothetical protein
VRADDGADALAEVQIPNCPAGGKPPDSKG